MVVFGKERYFHHLLVIKAHKEETKISKTIKLKNVAIFRHKFKANDIAIRIGGGLTSVNNIEGSKRCHPNLYDKLNKILIDNEE